MKIVIWINKVKVMLVTLVEGDSKAPFSIATTLRCRGGCSPDHWQTFNSY